MLEAEEKEQIDKRVKKKVNFTSRLIKKSEKNYLFYEACSIWIQNIEEITQ